MDVVRYFHTLRHLKPVQFYGRLVHRFHRANPDPGQAPPLRNTRGPWQTPTAKPQSMLAPTNFRFLNESREVVTAADWDAPRVAKLWRYNLHYFDDLCAADAPQRRDWHASLLDRWIAENPPPQGTGWEPYPLSLRIVNWIKWALAGNDLSAHQVHSLAVQARCLSQRLEWHLLGNHLLANAKALMFAGLWFDGDEARRWFDAGRSILEQQLPEQVLADGAHYERSPMYHALLLDDLLDLANLHLAFGEPFPGPWRETAVRMAAWLDRMTHPDGGIAFFNDAALGIAPSLSELQDYADRLGLVASGPAVSAEDAAASGYFRRECAGAVLIADLAPIGPDFLPGHAHADTLSFELSLSGRRVLVNSGTSVYGLGPERDRQRGTAAHNTMRLDRVDSSEVWSGFRVARRAYPFDIRLGPDSLSASHDGYRRLPGRPVHRRNLRLRPGELRIEDHVDGHDSHCAEVFLHVHPDFRVERDGETRFRLVGPFDAAIETDPAFEWRIDASTWHPGFGLSVENRCIVGTRHGPLPFGMTTTVSWPCAS